MGKYDTLKGDRHRTKAQQHISEAARHASRGDHKKAASSYKKAVKHKDSARALGVSMDMGDFHEFRERHGHATGAAKKAGSKKKMAGPSGPKAAIQTGKKGGRYVMTKGGKKVYLGKKGR